MFFHSILARSGWGTREHRRPAPPTRRRRLSVEQLEDRWVPATFSASSVSGLIADINAANLQGGANTIVFAPHTTFSLTSVDNTTDNPTGLPVIAANDNLTISGNNDVIERSAAVSTPAFRLFDVAAGASLTLKGLTLQNGSAYDGTGNSAGGAILNQGTLDLEHCVVSGNSADYGGAVLNSGTVLIDHSDLHGNTSGVDGGAIYSVFSFANAVTVDHSTLSDNVSGGAGGAIAGGTTLTIDDTVLSDNQSTGFGGAIANEGGDTTIQDSSLSDNQSSDSGGAIYETGSLVADHCDFTGNHAYTLGGAIANNGNGLTSVTLQDVTFTGNHTDALDGSALGGAVWSNEFIGSQTISHCQFINNYSDGGLGGAIYNLAAPMALDHCFFSGNHADALPTNSETGFGGAIAFDGTGPGVSMSYCTFIGNHANGGSGGAIYDADILTIDHTYAAGNSAQAGADFENVGSTTLIDSSIAQIDNNGTLTVQ
jgi:predicted outer membrane repeat protein